MCQVTCYQGVPTGFQIPEENRSSLFKDFTAEIRKRSRFGAAWRLLGEPFERFELLERFEHFREDAATKRVTKPLTLWHLLLCQKVVKFYSSIAATFFAVAGERY